MPETSTRGALTTGNNQRSLSQKEQIKWMESSGIPHGTNRAWKTTMKEKLMHDVMFSMRCVIYIYINVQTASYFSYNDDNV